MCSCLVSPHEDPLRCDYYYCLRLTDEETEAQSSYVTYFRSLGWIQDSHAGGLALESTLYHQVLVKGETWARAHH